MKFASDSEDEKMRAMKCYLQPIIEELIKDPKFNLQVLKLARLSKHKTANLSQLLSENLIYKNYVNKKIKDISLNNRIKEYEFLTFEDFEKEYSYRGEQYIPSIFVPNIQTADESKIPIVSAGIEADSESSPELEDYIIANTYSEDFISKEFYINEEKVLALTTPVFIIDNSIDYELVEKNAKGSLKPFTIDPCLSNKTMLTALNLKTYAHQINVRHESIGKSEFCITGAQINSECDPDSVRYYLPGYDEWLEINSIAKDDIGKLLYKWVYIAYSYDIEPYNKHFLYFNTFERDWASSRKFLGSATLDGLTLYLYGNMTYSDDYYAYNPVGGLTDFDIHLQSIYDYGYLFYFNYLYKLQFYLI